MRSDYSELIMIRERRMFLIQVAAGEDSPTSDIHRLASDANITSKLDYNLQITLCWHGVERNQQEATGRPGQET